MKAWLRRRQQSHAIRPGGLSIFAPHKRRSTMITGSAAARASSSNRQSAVTGLRFGTRIDRPDLLEIEVGRLRPKLLLVPVEEVEHISVDEERVLLSRDPRPHPDLVHELLLRARDKLRPFPI